MTRCLFCPQAPKNHGTNMILDHIYEQKHQSALLLIVDQTRYYLPRVQYIGGNNHGLPAPAPAVRAKGASKSEARHTCHT